MDDVRRAYAAAGITVDQPTAYGTYYRLRCTACGANVGNIGDRLLPGMAEALVAGQADLYAAGMLGCACGHQRATAPAQRFDEGDTLPPEYRDLLLKMLRHEGERAGNKSFLGFMATCADVAETLYPTAAARLIKAEDLAEELKPASMFHRPAVGLD